MKILLLRFQRLLDYALDRKRGDVIFNNRDIFLLIIVLTSYNQVTKSQQLPLFSQYTFNAFLLNPAAAGAEGYTAINATDRAQWVGVEGAPHTGNVSFQTRIMKRDYIESNAPIRRKYLTPMRSGRVGLGGGIYFDQAGLINQTCLFFTYAYHIARAKDQFSIGATFSLLQYKINTTSLSPSEQQNLLLGNNKLAIYSPDISVGAYYTNQNFFLGLSILQVTQGSVHVQNYSNSSFIIYRNCYITGGYKFELENDMVLEPSFFSKTSELWVTQFDATLKLIYAQRLWFGFAYRTSSTYIASFGLKIDRFYAGYAFDYSLTGILNSSHGSHELMVAIKLGDNVRRYRWMDRY